MSRIGASNTIVPTQSPVTGKGSTGDPAAARSAALETVRRNSPDEIQEAAAILVVLGDLVPDTQFESEDDDEGEKDTEEGVEQDTCDDDDPFHDGWDNEPGFAPDGQTLSDPSKSDDFEIPGGFRLLVDDVEGTCELEPPDWVKWRANSRYGRDWLNNLERRLSVLRFVGTWLAKHRVAFLRDPRPWHLGCDALVEIAENWTPVSPESFIDHIGLLEFGEMSIVQTAIRKANLVWPDGCSLPLEFIFSPESRMIWVANAVKDMAEKTKRDMKDVISRYGKTAIPKGKKTYYAKKPSSDCDFEQSIWKANAMADTKWTNVVKLLEVVMVS